MVLEHHRTNIAPLKCLGEVVLYTWVEWLKDQQHLWAPTAGPEQPAPDRLGSDAELAEALQQVGLRQKLFINSCMEGALDTSTGLRAQCVSICSTVHRNTAVATHMTAHWCLPYLGGDH